jgi:PAS domain-containing protein
MNILLAIPIEIAATKTEWHEKPADMVFFHDISVRKQAEEILRQSEERLKIALDIAASSIFDGEFYNIGGNQLKMEG